MLQLAHRGLHRTAPENTLAAFAQSLTVGFAGIETDVRLSADGEAVLYHDRNAPNGTAVATLSRSELSHLSGYIVPTLSEALDAFPDAYWNIEIKTPSVLPNCLAILQNYLHRRQLLISSFHHEVVLHVEKELRLDCAFLIAHRPAQLNELLLSAMPHPHLRTFIWDYEVLDLDLLNQSYTQGFNNFVYGPQTEQEHIICKAFPLQGIITDFPEFIGLTTGLVHQ
ncbi:glycerophosphodiester phosphodiesterase [Iodobacter ciconiae]|nr:glycerophosphodiester phosphodiesterase [Iodobacter ciconiae]